MPGRTTRKFEDLYGGLNPEQKDAVDTIEGPVMVIAGPGTGKTQILTLRIANILKQTDADASSVLALTFTESGAQAMRKRLVEIIGSEGYRVHIHTFHGFCNEVIKNNPDEFPRIIGSENVTDIEKIVIIKKIIDESKLKVLKPFGAPYYYLKDIRATISNLKRDNIAPEEVSLNQEEFGKVSEKDADKLTEFIEVYKAYEAELAKRNLYDYEDMIMEVIRALRSDEDLLGSLREEYQYILADEHQDANSGQNTLLELLSAYHSEPNLFIVGDEKQAIFRFQGASLENFLYFKERFPSARQINLVNNYRSHQEILDGAHSLIAGGNRIQDTGNSEVKSLRVELRAHSGTGGEIVVREFSKEEFEHRALADEVKKLIESGVEPSEIAVLYRDNRDVEPLMRVFDKEQLPYVIESDQNILADPTVSKLVILLRALVSYGDDALLAEVLHINFLGFDHIDVYKLLKGRGKDSLYTALRKSDEFKDFAKKFESWRVFSKNNSLLDTIELVIRESGLLESVLREPSTHSTGSGQADAMNSISNFYDQVKVLVEGHKRYTLDNLIEHIDLMIEHGVYLKRDTRRAALTNVRLMTAHRSKGLEFSYVYIIGAYDKHWGNKSSKTMIKVPSTGVSKNDNEDERRLFYVALTRAKVQAVISYATEGENGREQLPSQFIEEIDPKLASFEDMSKIEASLEKNFLDNFKPKPTPKPASSDKEYLVSLFDQQGLSVTGLNNYLTCPWRYFYQSLVRIPRPQSKHAMYGNAVHGALNTCFDKLMKEGEFSKSDLLKAFEGELDAQPLSEETQEELTERGKEALSGYFNTYSSKWSPEARVLNEYDVRGVEFKHVDLDAPVRLRGKLDKIEIQEPGSWEGGVVNVVDYKTAKPKSRNDIEGKTKTSNGDYKRQLVFYKLLLDEHGHGKFNMQSGEIDFVEPNPSGKYKREKFEITNDDLSQLSAEIARVTNEIRNLSFWDSRCDKQKETKFSKKCEFCALRDMIA